VDSAWQLNVLPWGGRSLVIGINLKQMRIIVVMAPPISAVTVSVCGIISFVGLAIPHLARMLVGTNTSGSCRHNFAGGLRSGVIELGRSISARIFPLPSLPPWWVRRSLGVLLRKTGGAWSE
jgi:iron complex transport system permease protein